MQLPFAAVVLGFELGVFPPGEWGSSVHERSCIGRRRALLLPGGVHSGAGHPGERGRF